MKCNLWREGKQAQCGSSEGPAALSMAWASLWWGLGAGAPPGKGILYVQLDPIESMTSLMTDESRVRGSQELVAAYTIENIDAGTFAQNAGCKFHHLAFSTTAAWVSLQF